MISLTSFCFSLGIPFDVKHGRKKGGFYVARIIRTVHRQALSRLAQLPQGVEGGKEGFEDL
jgi:hypothetical protein